jgi:hypothetical protein
LFVQANFQSFKALKKRERASLREVLKAIYNYVQDQKKEVQDFYDIKTENFDKLVSGLGWKPLEIKKTLLSMDMLRTSSSLVYDYNVKINGLNNWCISINAEDLKSEASYCVKEVK